MYWTEIDEETWRMGIMDPATGKIIVKPEYRTLGPPAAGMIAFESEGGLGFLDAKGKVLIKAKFSPDPHWGM